MKEVNQRKKGLWTQEEDDILLEYIKVHGRGHWNRIPKVTGLKRCGKSCRLRWLNYLSPHVKRGDFSEEEEDLIIRLHNLLGNRWSLIAGRVPGRTDNQVKNHWNTRLCKKLGLKKQSRKAVTFSTAQSSAGIEETHNNSELLENNRGTRNDEPFSVDEAFSAEDTLFFEHHGADASLVYHDIFTLNSPGLLDFLGGADTILI